MNSRRPDLLFQPRKLIVDFPPERRYLIGVSGGRDSVALLHQLLALGYRKLTVCHLNHELRGASAAADARFVGKLAQRAGLHCELGRTNVTALARKSQFSIETAARVARFAFFVSVARQKRCRTIFLAHHADDFVETALLNLFRGASPGGIAAMREVSSHRIGRFHLTIVRPLLDVWRSEIDRYVKSHTLKFREDKTNRALHSRRNRIRHRVIPYIEKQLGREVRQSIWRTAKIWSDENTLLDSLANSAISRGPTLDVVTLRKIPVALQRRVILSWLNERQIPNLGFDLVENIRQLILPNVPHAKTNLPRDLCVRRQKNKLLITFPRDRK